MTMRKWCRHINKTENWLGIFVWVYNDIGEGMPMAFVSKFWKYCPICGAKRPERKGKK